MSLLSVRNLNTGYGKKQVLFDVSLDIEEGEKTLLVGANGSGKSTLFKSIFGLLPLWKDEKENKGQIILDHDTDISNIPTHQLIKMGMVYIPQQDQLYENFTVEKNIEFSILNNTLGKEEINSKIEEFFNLFPILGDLKNRKANLLSGGERKFLSLGMGIINNPKLLFLDEPFAGVSIPVIDKLLDVISNFTDSDKSVMIIEHRINHIFSFFDKRIGLRQGRLLPDFIEQKKDLNKIML